MSPPNTNNAPAPTGTRPRRRSSGTKLLLLGLAANLNGAESFSTVQAPATRPSAKATPVPVDKRSAFRKAASCPNLGRTSTSMDVFSADMDSLSIPTNPMGDIFDGLGSMLMADSAAAVDVEAEGMNLAAHALLDFSSHWAQATIALRMADVIGRLFVLGQSLLPGHGMSPDELAIQLGFLAVSCNSLHKLVQPKLKAAQASQYLTPQDRLAFRKVFKPAGLNWSEYRELSLESMEWVTMEPGQTVKDDAVYWLYEGTIEIESASTATRVLTGDKTVSGFSGLFGENRIAKILGITDCGKSGTKTTVIGEQGATFLRMSTNKLGKLMKHDDALATSMNRLVFQSMKNRITEGALGA
ncbi:expressed unknown protein [Seminavis robusta]|uniref:Uncharacterized protein n=1 Tax=Seminavis robusta TaxID=568900 RepID=A0A9N8HBH7_9STRA|nr:expressed unknown protein [Seminavis robusta]|eukprot:Sro261_g101880.1 n/a (356) ;mRNA; f:75001-76068